MSEISEQELIAFMEARSLCVIATVGANMRPEAAFVGYSSNNKHELIIGTSNKSRKYKNIMQHNSVAFVIADTTGEVQYEGDAEIIDVETYEALIAEGRFKELPGFDKYRSDPTQVYLKVAPTWIRFIAHGEADEIREFTEFS